MNKMFLNIIFLLCFAASFFSFQYKTYAQDLDIRTSQEEILSNINELTSVNLDREGKNEEENEVLNHLEGLTNTALNTNEKFNYNQLISYIWKAYTENSYSDLSNLEIPHNNPDDIENFEIVIGALLKGVITLDDEAYTIEVLLLLSELNSYWTLPSKTVYQTSSVFRNILKDTEFVFKPVKSYYKDTSEPSDALLHEVINILRRNYASLKKDDPHMAYSIRDEIKDFIFTNLNRADLFDSSTALLRNTFGFLHNTYINESNPESYDKLFEYYRWAFSLETLTYYDFIKDFYSGFLKFCISPTTYKSIKDKSIIDNCEQIYSNEFNTHLGIIEKNGNTVDANETSSPTSSEFYIGKALESQEAFNNYNFDLHYQTNLDILENDYAINVNHPIQANLKSNQLNLSLNEILYQALLKSIEFEKYNHVYFDKEYLEPKLFTNLIANAFNNIEGSNGIFSFDYYLDNQTIIDELSENEKMVYLLLYLAKHSDDTNRREQFDEVIRLDEGFDLLAKYLINNEDTELLNQLQDYDSKRSNFPIPKDQ